MYQAETFLRVRYAETDKMGVVYHGNFAQYFEVGRVEAIRGLSYSYKDLESDGIIMPVIEMNTKFVRPAVMMI
jgi:acyl-CoA thioester hydrolase